MELQKEASRPGAKPYNGWDQSICAESKNCNLFTVKKRAPFDHADCNPLSEWKEG